MRRGILTLDELRDRVARGDIDTVVTAVPDMQGRLVGKRVTAEFFLDHCLEHGTHFCTYLLATDMELNTPDGFGALNWESGYGDYQAKPDWDTLRAIPWLEKTALVLCDTVDETKQALVEIAPRTILKRQVERATAMGFTPKMATELEFYVFKDSFDTAKKKNYTDLERFGWYNEDYQLLQATKAEPLYRR
ncbi:MAG: glutamine synthetase, partial [Thermomicrobiales bacterium]